MEVFLTSVSIASSFAPITGSKKTGIVAAIPLTGLLLPKAHRGPSYGKGNRTNIVSCCEPDTMLAHLPGGGNNGKQTLTDPGDGQTYSPVGLVSRVKAFLSSLVAHATGEEGKEREKLETFLHFLKRRETGPQNWESKTSV